MNSNQSFYPLVFYCIIKTKAPLYLLASKRQDTSFRANLQLELPLFPFYPKRLCYQTGNC